MTVNVGVVKVPDERLTKLTELFKPKKRGRGRRDLRRPAGAADCRPMASRPPRSRPTSWPGCAPPTSCSMWCAPSRIRPCAHPDGSVDPWRDIERLDLEFVLADLRQVEKRIEKLRRPGPPRHAGRARGERSRAGGAREARARAARGQAHPRHRARRRRGQAHPRLPLPDREAGAGAAQHRRGRHRRAADDRGRHRRALRAQATRRSRRCRPRSRWRSASSTPRRRPSSAPTWA